MLQNGTTMTAGKTITFQRPSSGDSSYFPGQIALQFYTDFALPRKSVYTWNDQMPNALDHFAEGKLGFFFGYRFNEPEIQSKSRGVDYDIAAVPQVNTSQAVNFSNYWVYTVAGKTSNANEAWNFLQYASQPKRIQPYLTSTNQTSVLRALLNEQLADPATSVFAQQALTAKSWYQGRNPEEAENIFGEMIEAVLNETDTVASAINTAAQKIQQGY
ncbi:hypothetical protein IID19_02005, partial [Patescibacteria group bacterium]|nr:hypothetical protein [Patescibacteria group bacterium]